MFKLLVEFADNEKIIIRDSLFEKSDFPGTEESSSESIDTIGKPHLFKDSGVMSEEIRGYSLDLIPVQRSHLLLILAIPYGVSLEELLSEYRESISYTRQIYSFTSCYSCVISFKTQSAADKYYTDLNGKQFSFQESCYVLYLSEIILTYSLETIPDMTELPMCPICIERLDPSLTTVRVIIPPKDLYSGTRWTPIRDECTVCKFLSSKEQPDSKCEDCGDSLSLWVCLICGYVACGRYREAHSKLHAQIQNHNFTVDVESSRIWDYEADAFAHRVTMEVPNFGPTETNKDFNNVVWEFEYLINSQLESQREVLEQKINEKLDRVNSEMFEKIKFAKNENQSLKRHVARLKAKERKKKALIEKLERIKIENEELRSINEGMLRESQTQDPVFETAKDKKSYLQLEKLKKELEEKIALL